MMILCKIRTRRGISSSSFSPSLANIHRYDFEYEEDDEEEGGDVDIENKYYNAKQMKATDPDAAIEEFLGVPALEKEKGDWGFKGLKQAIKLEFKLGLYDKVRAFSKAPRSALTCRPLNTTPSSSPMSRTLLRETTPKNLSTTSSIT
jgi:COP9 signalosome complex subunit 2